MSIDRNGRNTRPYGSPQLVEHGSDTRVSLWNRHPLRAFVESTDLDFRCAPGKFTPGTCASPQSFRHNHERAANKAAIVNGTQYLQRRI